MQTKRFRLHYPFSKFWLIFWIIIFLPIGLVLLSHLEYTSNRQTVKWDYQGNRFWLYFWAILFFPISLLLLLFKGSLLMITSDS